MGSPQAAVSGMPVASATHESHDWTTSARSVVKTPTLLRRFRETSSRRMLAERPRTIEDLLRQHAGITRALRGAQSEAPRFVQVLSERGRRFGLFFVRARDEHDLRGDAPRRRR